MSEETWVEIDGALTRTFRLPSFAAAIAFVDRVAALAEREDHHPDIDIRWTRVTLRWRTHSAHAITERDHALARMSAALVDENDSHSERPSV